MKNRMCRFITMVLLSLYAFNMWGNDGDIFTAKTVEGVDMTFKVISESDKTCQVGKNDGAWFANSNSISVEYEGNITIPEDVNGYHVIRIGRGAFDHCNIKSIIMPSDIQSIYREAFNSCYSLQSVALSRNLEKINGLAFNFCTALKDVAIPPSVDYIGEDAFRACRSLETITVAEGNTHFDSRNNCNAIIETSLNELRLGCKNTIIPITVTSIGKYAFPSVNESNPFFIPDNIVSIKEYAFEVCKSLSSVVIPNSVKEIGNMAFYGCASLVKVKSLIETPFTVLNGTFNEISSDAILYVPFGTKSLYESVGWNRFFQSVIEEGDKNQFSLTIIVTGNGSVSYGTTSVKGKTSTFTVNEGTSVTITLTPDDGYRVKSLTVNNTDVTPSISNNQYTISNISADTSVEAEFEAIPPTTYTLSIKATGNGMVSYGNTSVKDKTSTFTVNEGTSVTITLTPDDGYRVKSLTVNNTDVTSSISNSKYTISSISANTNVEAVFEAIPQTTYTLSVKSTGNGSVTYGGISVRSTTSTFTVNKGTSVTVTLSPDGGYRVKSLTVNNTDVTLSISNNKYTISSINANTTIEAVFEVIPSKTYTLSIKATGNGTATYGETSVRGKTNSFTVIEGSAAIIVLSPDNGYWTKSILQDAVDVTASVNEQKYVIASVKKNISIEISFAKNIEPFSVDGNGYSVSSHEKKTVMVNKINGGKTIEIPAQVSYKNYTWSVVGIDNDAIKDNKELAAIIWNPSALFNASVDNPNVLLYVTSADYAPTEIANVVVNGNAEKIILKDATNGNDFYCPKEFTAKTISYTHNYGMTTGYGEAKGWESIVLPFDVQKVEHPSKGELIPYLNWKSGDAKKPFWLMEYGTGGWSHASKIKANTPYIISMPNHTNYKPEFRVNGSITFSADNVKVKASDNMQSVNQGGKAFVPNYSNQTSESIYSLNTNSDYTSYYGEYTEGSRFVLNLRPVHPFEAYMTSTSNATRSIAISDDMTTGLDNFIETDWNQGDGKIYNLQGQMIKTEKGKSIDEAIKELPAGMYIVNGKKLIIR